MNAIKTFPRFHSRFRSHSAIHFSLFASPLFLMHDALCVHLRLKKKTFVLWHELLCGYAGNAG
jgi:hypothetical protein